jgi:tyrosinase
VFELLFTGLTPFWTDATSYWSSTTAQDWRRLGYDYPEFEGLDLSNPEAVSAAIAAAVNKLYNGGDASLSSSSAKIESAATVAAGTVSGASKVDDSAAEVKQNPAATVAAGTVSGASKVDDSAAEAKQNPLTVSNPNPGATENVVYQWTARIRCKQYELNDSFWVLIFFSPKPAPIPEDPREWRTSMSYVGSHHFFVNTRMENCENCQRNAAHVTEGFVQLNHALAEYSGLNSLDPASVVPFLKENLEWRAQNVSDHVP